MTGGEGKRRFALSTKILLLAFGNLLFLGLVLLLFARFQLHLEFNWFSARDRVVSLARELTLDLEDTQARSRDELLRRYKQIYGVEFYLFGNPLVQIGGPAMDLPAAVIDEIHKPPEWADRQRAGHPFSRYRPKIPRVTGWARVSRYVRPVWRGTGRAPF